MTGLLQVFFEGSWSQVCGGRFEVADVNVTCRQLGYGAGTIVPQFPSDADLLRLQSTPVFPEIAISASGCTGSEERLLDCAQEIGPITTENYYYYDYTSSRRSCLDSRNAGLRIACVGTPEQGAVMVHMVTAWSTHHGQHSHGSASHGSSRFSRTCHREIQCCTQRKINAPSGTLCI